MFNYKRIVVIGCPGAGKSTFSRKLHAVTNLPLFYLDALYWNKDCTHITREELIEKQMEIFATDSFIIDGNFKSTLELRIKEADVVFLFDLPTETAQKSYNILQSLCNRLILWGGNYFTDFLPFSDGWIIWDKRCDSGIKNTFADGEMAWCSFHTPVRIFHQLWNGMIREGEKEKRVHPTQKPIRVLSDILNDFSGEGDNVLDVFGGSGSTLIACEQLNRNCYMMELDPKYIDVIIERWEQFTGEKAVLIETT